MNLSSKQRPLFIVCDFLAFLCPLIVLGHDCNSQGKQQWYAGKVRDEGNIGIFLTEVESANIATTSQMRA